MSAVARMQTQAGALGSSTRGPEVASTEGTPSPAHVVEETVATLPEVGSAVQQQQVPPASSCLKGSMAEVITLEDDEGVGS